MGAWSATRFPPVMAPLARPIARLPAHRGEDYDSGHMAVRFNAAGDTANVTRHYGSDFVEVANVTMTRRPGGRFVNANGPAAYVKPDGSEWRWGRYAAGQPTGTWVLVRAPGIDLRTCPGLREQTSVAAAWDLLDACFYEEIERAAAEGLPPVTVQSQRLRGDRVEGLSIRQLGRRPHPDTVTCVDGAARDPSVAYDVFGRPVASTRLGDEPEEVVGALPIFALDVPFPYETDEGVTAPPSFYASKCETAPFYRDGFDRALEARYGCRVTEQSLYLLKRSRLNKYERRQTEGGVSEVGFRVDAEGYVTDVRTVSFVEEDLDARARAIVLAMPPWIPALRNGKPVPAYHVVGIEFLH